MMEPLTDEQLWGTPAPEPVRGIPALIYADDAGIDYRCPECGFFTPRVHARDCSLGRQSA
jgi:hypothetical protein